MIDNMGTNLHQHLYIIMQTIRTHLIILLMLLVWATLPVWVWLFPSWFAWESPWHRRYDHWGR